MKERGERGRIKPNTSKVLVIQKTWHEPSMQAGKINKTAEHGLKILNYLYNNKMV